MTVRVPWARPEGCWHLLPTAPTPVAQRGPLLPSAVLGPPSSLLRENRVVHLWTEPVVSLGRKMAVYLALFPSLSRTRACWFGRSGAEGVGYLILLFPAKVETPWFQAQREWGAGQGFELRG